MFLNSCLWKEFLSSGVFHNQEKLFELNMTEKRQERSDKHFLEDLNPKATKK